MSSNVKSVEIYLSNWFFPRIGRIKLYALPAAKKMLAGFCPHSLQGHPVLQKA